MAHVPQSPNIPLSGWHKYLQKTKEVFDDLTQLPPPGWKPPKEERDAYRAVHGPSLTKRAVQGMKRANDIITTPPFVPPRSPESQRRRMERPLFAGTTNVLRAAANIVLTPPFPLAPGDLSPPPPRRNTGARPKQPK
jgi:hypothetical protein